MARVLIICSVLAAFVAIAHGYGSGAPKDACGDMTPQHHTEPQKSPFPYVVTSSKKLIKGGDKVTITITVGPTVKEFKGFLLQARVGDTPIGKFSPANGVKIFDCGSGKANSATHASANAKTKIAVEWTAPPRLDGQVKIYATVAKNGGEFWVKQLTNTLAIKT